MLYEKPGALRLRRGFSAIFSGIGSDLRRFVLLFDGAQSSVSGDYVEDGRTNVNRRENGHDNFEATHRAYLGLGLLLLGIVSYWQGALEFGRRHIKQSVFYTVFGFAFTLCGVLLLVSIKHLEAGQF
jgi:hypothetical protein